MALVFDKGGGFETGKQISYFIKIMLYIFNPNKFFILFIKGYQS